MIWFSVVVPALSRNVYWLPCAVMESATDPVIHGIFARVQIGSMARLCELSSAPIPILTCLEMASWTAAAAVSVVAPASSETTLIFAPPSDLMPPAALMFAAGSARSPRG